MKYNLFLIFHLNFKNKTKQNGNQLDCPVNCCNHFRTFKHGAFHGVFFGLMVILPVICINALFERRGFKYIAVNAGFWIVSLAPMGGVICAMK